MKITVFESLTKKEAQGVIDAAEWIRAIRDGKFKPTVDQVRSYIKLGDKDKARDWKMKLAAAVWAGECRKGRFFKHTTSRTGYAIFDFDDLREDQLLAARQLLEVFPWIVAVHVTASGRGLRVVANIGVVHIDVYRQAYEQVAERLHEITGLELDMACRDFARASLASYDPEIYYNPQATVYPYGEEHNPLNYVPATGPDPSEDFRYMQNPVTQALILGEQAERAAGSATAPDIDAILDRFFSTHPYVQGSRTRTMLYLGRYLRWRRVQSWQLDEAISKACARGVEPGITANEIERAIRWGYEHGEEGGKNTTNWGQRGQLSNMYPFHGVGTEENPDSEDIAENEKEEGDIIEEQCPQFADDIYEHLPDEIKKLLVVAKDNKERDIILLGILTVSSTLFPALRTIYGNRKYSAHIYTFIVAGAGAGKGGAMNGVILAKKTDREFERKYKAAKKEYEKKCVEWDMELKLALKERRKPDMDLKPEEPVHQAIISTPNSSKSQMIINVRNAGEDGLVIVSSEGDVLVVTLHADYGGQAAELRMFFHHEEVRQHFKIDKEQIVIPHPHVAMLLTGTPEQVVSLIQSTENGLFSRFLFYLMNDESVWKSQSPLKGNGGIDLEELYGELGEKLKVNFFNTSGKEIMINFTAEQWDTLDSVFEAELGIVSAEGEKNADAVVKRYGLITMRIAMTLSGYRIMEAGWQVTEYTCQDEDFYTALHIVLTCMKHANHVSTMMKKKENRGKVTYFYKLLPILKRMPDTFRYSEFRKEVEKSGFTTNAAKRGLKKYVANGLLSKDNGIYKKTKTLKKRSI
ncbi:DUF3987 domain-containing protein [Bacteroides caecigallinarum]|uniref:DUF3987 domain-containing protein n=1 Tax=Bacteroides caecigallinarum TaxID=1411144 RepID=UPI00195CDED8|nr:DUF3987 domain-containing protein [Bacteroides caecigallinarum]MBM6889409.1 DUF3987 domain-containing protein [Bacteroides caecigallinarum]